MSQKKIVCDLMDPEKKNKKRPPTVRFSNVPKGGFSKLGKIRMPEQRKRRRRKLEEHKRITNFLNRYFSEKGEVEKNYLASILNYINKEEEKLAPPAKNRILFEAVDENFFKKEKKWGNQQTKKDLESLAEDFGLEIDLSDISGPIDEFADLEIKLPEEKKFKAKVFSESFYLPPRQSQTSVGDFWQNLALSLKKKPVFALASVLLLLVIPLFGFLGGVAKAKDMAMSLAYSGYHNLMLAKKQITSGDFKQASQSFSRASENLSQAEKTINSLAGKSLNWLAFLPGVQKIADQNNILLAAKDISFAGRSLAFSLSQIKFNQLNILGPENQDKPLTDVLLELKRGLELSLQNLSQAQQNLRGVSPDSLPASFGVGFLKLKTQLNSGLQSFSQAPVLIDNLLKILGHERSKKYLVLFQNNSEIRATGGFIGSYGILDISKGQIKNLFVDNIFNPDGQLREKIMPPVPIQKISANWSMHDANWFADFPTSARKVAQFYEKTGGPTVDGVFALTPQVIARLLEITGPIYLPDYGIEIDAQNFIQNIQYKVEEDFNRQENRPKKILSDLAPLLFSKLGAETKNHLTGVAAALAESLDKKEMLFYFNDEALQAFIRKQGWGGQLKNTSGDFLMFVNSNINGYKTDYVISQKITHHIRISPSGEIFDTLRVTRAHHGGSSLYDWYNRVNSNYFRVYVPEGSELLYAAGNTPQSIQAKIDYSQEQYFKDRDLRKIWAGRKTTKRGIDIFTETGKTVFGGWTFTSPGEKTDLLLQYKLPFTLDFKKPVQIFSLVLQKQPGVENSQVSLIVDLPPGKETFLLNNGEMKKISSKQFKYSGEFLTDKIFGFVFR